MLEAWKTLKPDFSESLLLGNGASIAVHSAFEYSSLLGVARNNHLVTDAVNNLFTSFDTNDFELVLEIISHAHTVNTVLDIKDQVTEQIYSELRMALLGSVQSVHPSHTQVENQCAPMITFMKDFKTILSLNYDLIVYWTMLAARATLGNWFKDCFNESSFRYGDWKKLREPYRAKGTTLVFYPHGSLVLATDSMRHEYKVAVHEDGPSLLETIGQHWTSHGSSPLFVSEGETKQKLNAIRRSPYLSSVFDSVLPNVETLVVYGWAMGKQDIHILDRIAGNLKALAIGIHTAGKSPNQIKAKCTDYLSKIQKYSDKIEIRFFDAQESGVWIYT